MQKITPPILQNQQNPPIQHQSQPPRNYARLVFLVVLSIALVLTMANLSGRAVNSLVAGWDEQTSAHLDALIGQASLSIVISSALNAIVSVIQDSEINIVIGSIALGEALDPVNDAIEYFTGIMWLSTTSLAIQRFIHFLAMQCTNFLLLLILLPYFLLAAIRVFERSPIGERFGSTKAAKQKLALIGKGFFVFFLIGRFLVPFSVLLSSFADVDDIHEQIRALEGIQESTEENYDLFNSEQESEGFRIGNLVPNIRASINRIISDLRDSIQQFISLSISFIIQTIFIPIIMLIVLKTALENVLRSAW